jgi:hypothetical protein
MLGNYVMLPLGVLNANPTVKAWLEPIFPAVLGPTDQSILQGALDGGSAILWAPWLSTIGYYIFAYASFYLYFMFVSSLLRRQYVDVESIAFPLATYILETIDMASKPKEGKVPRLFKSYLFWIGALISFIYCIVSKTGLLMGTNLRDLGFPQLERGYDITPISTSLVGVLLFVVEPFSVGLGYMLNMDILITTIIAFIVLNIIMPNIVVATGAGTWSPNKWNRVITGWQNTLGAGNLNTTPYTWGYNGMLWGIFFAIAIWPVIIHRKAFIDTIRSALKSTPSAEEENEPFRYRTIWIGVIVFGLLWLASFAIAGVPPQYAVLGIVWSTIWWTAMARFRAESGMVVGAWMNDYMVIGQPHKAWFNAVIGLQSSNEAGAFAFQATNEWAFTNQGPMGRTLENYKVASLTKTKARDMFISQAVGVLVGIVTTLVVGLWWWYTYGSATLGRRVQMVLINFRWNGEHNFITTGTLPRGPYLNEFFLYMFIIGIAVTVIFYFLRSRYTSFLLNPVGILLAVYTHSVPIWLSFLVALIAKWLTFRVGGADLYEKKGLPIATGLIAGLVFGFAFNWLLNILTFYGFLVI